MKTNYDEIIKSAAAEHLPFTDWRFLKAQYWQESKFDPNAISPAGARGIAQIMPGAWRDWYKKLGYELTDIHKPEPSIFVGAAYMADLYRQWKSPRPEIDRYCLALASYNAGLGNILKAQKETGGKLLYREIIKGLPQVTGPKNSNETIVYVRKILGFYCKEVTG